ncbi:MAG: polyprenyl synthetase family protein [Thermovirgaceae bacterium]|nr:polyprenyl synthetase family protein [Synergistales bacterium]HPC75125.1 polyprenyl synthetase family protein [Synergistales bacterium]HRS48403.1 polyprenyl synthetase family protein [Thermovirgaceae bacterium]HRU90367.1 polyprenyl synthetase family protein [Thermovirgaceae bacterium]
MTYSLLAGGKRTRPLLCILSGEVFGVTREDLLPMALACEMIHTASLIHDDLPEMDDAALRRGKPSNHAVFGESLALLAGDALFLWAFEYARAGLLARGTFSCHSILEALGVLLDAAGPFGICGGQVLDTDPLSTGPREEHPWTVARSKTAVLLSACVQAGAILGEAGPEERRLFAEFGDHLGTAFQIADDIIDVTGRVSKTGKTPGKDSAQGKITFVSVFGLEEAKRMAGEETYRARKALSAIGRDVAALERFTGMLAARDR